MRPIISVDEINVSDLLKKREVSYLDLEPHSVLLVQSEKLGDLFFRHEGFYLIVRIIYLLAQLLQIIVTLEEVFVVDGDCGPIMCFQ